MYLDILQAVYISRYKQLGLIIIYLVLKSSAGSDEASHVWPAFVL